MDILAKVSQVFKTLIGRIGRQYFPNSVFSGWPVTQDKPDSQTAAPSRLGHAFRSVSGGTRQAGSPAGRQALSAASTKAIATALKSREALCLVAELLAQQLCNPMIVLFVAKSFDRIEA
jgi:hypothetical protein